jgi:hypothetical protein
MTGGKGLDKNSLILHATIVIRFLRTSFDKYNTKLQERCRKDPFYGLRFANKIKLQKQPSVPGT